MGLDGSMFEKIYLCLYVYIYICCGTVRAGRLGSQAEYAPLERWWGRGRGSLYYTEGRASEWRRSHQCHYKHLPAWPTSNAVSFHQPQPTQGHRVNARNRWSLGGEKGGEGARGESCDGGEGDFKNRMRELCREERECFNK